MSNESNPALVAVLCVSDSSCYHGLPGVVPYSRRRDARTFSGGMPVVCHPPCRMWSHWLRHQARGSLCEMALGLWCLLVTARDGGIVEQPARSRLFRHLPPGVGRLVCVDQSWFGYPQIKRTWLWCVRCVPPAAPFGFEPAGSRRLQRLCSRAQRSRTTPEFAAFLVGAARQAVVGGAL